MADDERDRRSKRDGFRRGAETPISLRDAVFGQPELSPDGGYQVGFTALVYWGNKPAWAQIQWRPRVNGQPVSDTGWQLVSESRIEHRFNLSWEKTSVAVDLKCGDWERTISVRIVELPKSKRKLELLGSTRQPEGLLVVLRRVGRDGKAESGKISAFDFVEKGERLEWTPLTWKMESEEEMIQILLPFHDRSRKVTFFLPDDREVKVTVDVPGKPPERVIEAEVVQPSVGQRITEAWRRGRRGELLAAKDPAKVLPLAAVAGAVALFAFRGWKGGGE